MKDSRTAKTSIIFCANVISIITLFIYASAGGFESAAVQTCIEAWPGETAVSIRMMLTLPALVQSVFMLVTGPFFGKKISYRFAGIAGLALVAAGGTVPAFFSPSWLVVLIFRGAGIGLGAGLLSMRTALLIKSVPRGDSGKWIGIAGACAALVSMAFSPLAGALAQVHWNYCFLVNIPAFACLVFCVIFLREPQDEQALPEAADGPSGPETQPSPSASAAAAPGTRPDSGTVPRMNPRVILYLVIVFITNVIAYSAISGISTLFAENGLGLAGAAGITISVYSLAGALGSLLLKLLQKAFRRQLITVCAITCGAGMLVVNMAPNAALAACGMAMIGFCYFPIAGILQVYNGEDQPPEKLALSSIFIMMGTMTAVFVSNWFILLCGKLLHFRGSEVSSALLAGAVIFFLTGIFWAALQARRAKR